MGYPSPRARGRLTPSPPPDVELDELLGGRYRSTLFWDITHDPSQALHLTRHGTHEKISSSRLATQATEPGAHFMKIVCDEFPWPIIIELPRRETITVEHVLVHIYEALQESLTRDEWEDESKNRRKAMYRAMCSRLARGQPSYKVDGHVKRVDYLMDKTLFLGLKPVGPPDAPDEWLLKVGSPPKKDRGRP